MKKIQKGDIVGRISYGKDILFKVDRIIKLSDRRDLAILKGVNYRIEVDSFVDDLRIIDKKTISKRTREMEDLRNKRINGIVNKRLIKENTGRILHLDGDRRYSNKSFEYYKKMRLDAIVKNIPENKQAYWIQKLLDRYNPDILVITGHDSMIKNDTEHDNLYNYRNSRHFINTVQEARKWEKRNKKDLVIFAGACQSFFEKIMESGANFASSPGRILIDFIDPLIVAEKVATTDANRYIYIQEIISELNDGIKGIGGTRARGKRIKIIY